jgi:hypothetical protein
LYYRSFSIAAHALVTCYSDYIGQTSAGTKKGSSAATDFLLKEAESFAKEVLEQDGYADSLLESSRGFICDGK